MGRGKRLTGQTRSVRVQGCKRCLFFALNCEKMHLFKSVSQCFMRAGYVPICGKRRVLLLLCVGGPADPAGGGWGGQRSKGAAQEPGWEVSIAAPACPRCCSSQPCSRTELHLTEIACNASAGSFPEGSVHSDMLMPCLKGSLI